MSGWFSSTPAKSLFVKPNLEEVVSDNFDKYEFPLVEFSDFDKLEQEIEDKNGDYKLLFEEEERVMWKKITGEGGSKTISEDHSHLTIRHKYKMVVNYPIQVFYDVLRAYDFRYLWDNREAGREILQIFNIPGKPQNQVVEYLVKKGNLIVSSRDLITVNAEKYDEKTNTYLMIGKSADSFPKETKSDFVRITVLFLGMKVIPIDENRCEFWCVTQVTPGGLIPNMIYDWALTFLPKEFHETTAKGCQKRIEMNYPSYTNYYQLYKKNTTTTTTTTE